jgi:hypothetical protein
VKEPLHQLGTAHAEWILEILARPGAIPVDRDREAQNANFGHERAPIFW